MFRLGIACLIIFYVGVVPATNRALAQAGIVVGGIAGIVGAHEAGKEFQKAIDRARDAAKSLIQDLRNTGDAWLTRIDEIANRTISDAIGKSEEAAIRILEDATKRLDALRGQIIADIEGVIRKAECGGRRWLLEDLRIAVGSLGEAAGMHQIRITPAAEVPQSSPWYRLCLFGCRDPYLIPLTFPPNDTWKRVERLMDMAIDVNQITDDTPADNIVSTYEFLSAFARKLACTNEGNETRYIDEYVEYQGRARQWTSILKVRFQ